MALEIKQLNDAFSVSSQISTEDVKALADRGVKSLICNRPDGEAADQVNVSEIEAAAEEVGVEVRYLPVIPGKFSDQDIDGFLAAYESMDKPIHAYCRTGTRSITLWSLYQRRLGVSPENLLSTAAQHGYDLSSALQVGREAATTKRDKSASYDIVIFGAGAAGIAAASSLLLRVKDLSIAIIDPAEVHYYQPGWTLVGAGVFSQRSTVKTMVSLIPEGVEWIKAAVGTFEPEHNRVRLEDTRPVYYERLIVAPGIKLDWWRRWGTMALPQTTGLTWHLTPGAW